MQKTLTKENISLLIGQDICITYKEPHNENVVVVTRILRADETGIVIQMNMGPKVVLTPEIKSISWKNVTFISPKRYFDKQNDNELNMQMNKINTQIIEQIKHLPTYYLSTRSARFSKNGSFEKKKISQKQFELEIFHWIQRHHGHIEFCPLALLNNELLLVLYQKRFLLLKKNFSIVFDTKYNDINTIVTFVFDKNQTITEKRKISLRALAEDLL